MGVQVAAIAERYMKQMMALHGPDAASRRPADAEASACRWA